MQRPLMREIEPRPSRQIPLKRLREVVARTTKREKLEADGFALKRNQH